MNLSSNIWFHVSLIRTTLCPISTFWSTENEWKNSQISTSDFAVQPTKESSTSKRPEKQAKSCELSEKSNKKNWYKCLSSQKKISLPSKNTNIISSKFLLLPTKTNPKSPKKSEIKPQIFFFLWFFLLFNNPLFRRFAPPSPPNRGVNKKDSIVFPCRVPRKPREWGEVSRYIGSEGVINIKPFLSLPSLLKNSPKFLLYLHTHFITIPQQMKKHRKFFFALGVILILFGLLVVISPQSLRVLFSIVLGTVLIISGIYSILNVITNKTVLYPGLTLATGILNLLLWILVLVSQGAPLLQKIFAFIVAIRAIIRGSLLFINGFQSKQSGGYIRLLDLLLGFGLIILAVLIIFNPFGGVNIITSLFGLSIIGEGVAMCGFARKIKKSTEVTVQIDIEPIGHPIK